MTLPAAIWPYIMGLSALLAIVCLAARDHAAVRALCAILIALIALRVVSSVFGNTTAYMAVAAMIWATVAGYIIRATGSTGGGILALSALCYFWAGYSGAPRVVGSLPFVISDALLITAILWIGSSGICSIYQRTLDLGWRGGGFSHRSADLVLSQKLPEKVVTCNR